MFLRLARFLEADDQRSVVKFARLFKTVEMMHAEHSKHEDELVYPLFNSYFPGYTRYSSKVPFLKEASSAPKKVVTEFNHS